jgi:hypothetical protein
MPNIKLSSLNKGLVGHWTMSQDSLKGSLLADKTPYENDGTIYGATFTTDRKGKANSAMSFDGVDDYIDCGNVQKDLSLSSVTISIWAKGAYKHLSVFFVDGKSKLGLGFYNYNGYKNLIVTSGDSIDKKPLVIIDDWSDTEWNHIVITYDSLHNPIGYLNNVLLSNSIEDNYWIEDKNNLLIGRRTTGNYFNGSIDDVRIYNRALSQEEITLLYNSYNPKIVMKTSLPKIKLYGGDY